MTFATTSETITTLFTNAWLQPIHIQKTPFFFLEDVYERFRLEVTSDTPGDPPFEANIPFMSQLEDIGYVCLRPHPETMPRPLTPDSFVVDVIPSGLLHLLDDHLWQLTRGVMGALSCNKRESFIYFQRVHAYLQAKGEWLASGTQPTPHTHEVVLSDIQESLHTLHLDQTLRTQMASISDLSTFLFQS